LVQTSPEIICKNKIDVRLDEVSMDFLKILSYYFGYNKKVITATTTKIITNHLAISIENPAIPFIPIMAKTNAKIKNTTAR
jgi:hypothetical protein